MDTVINLIGVPSLLKTLAIYSMLVAMFALAIQGVQEIAYPTSKQRKGI